MSRPAAYLVVAAVAALACVPEATPGEDAARVDWPSEEGCEVGAVGSFVDDLGALHAAYRRGVDGAVLVAHVRTGADVATASLPSESLEPCGATGAFDLAALDLTDRELAIGCGGAALAPDANTVVSSGAEAVAHIARCNGEAWAWLWTPRTCEELRARIPGVRTGRHGLEPQVDRATRRASAFCDLDDPAGAWTRVVGIEGSQGELDALDLTPVGDLVRGLELAAAGVGSVDASHLVFPGSVGTFAIRFRCSKGLPEDLDVPALEIHVDDAAAARAFVTSGAEVRRPSAAGNRIALAHGGAVGIVARPSLWGSVAPPGPEWPSVEGDRIDPSFAGRWTLGAEPFLDTPFFIAASPFSTECAECAQIAWSVRHGDYRCGDGDRTIGFGAGESTKARGRWTVDVR